MQVVLSESQKERSGAMRVESGKKIFLGTKSNRDDRAYLNVLYFLRAPTPKSLLHVRLLILCFFIICSPHGTPYTPRTDSTSSFHLPLLIGC